MASNILINLCNVQVASVYQTIFGQQAGVYCVAVDPATGDVYFGGRFDSVNGVARSGLACITRKGILKAWNPNVLAGAWVQGIAFTAAGIYVVGNFGQIGSTFASGVALLDTSGTVLGWTTTVKPNVTVGSGGQVNTVTTDAAGNVFIGGTNGAQAFSSAGASIWNAQILGPISSVLNGIFSIVVVGASPTQMVYLAGDFTKVYTSIGVSALRTGLQQFNGYNSLATDGYATAWNTNANSSCYSLCLDTGGNLYVGGAFTSILGTARNGLAGLSVATPTLTSWAPTPAASGGAVVAANGNDIYWANFGGSGPTGTANSAGCMDSGGTAHAWDPQVSQNFSLNFDIMGIAFDTANPLIPAVYVVGQFFEVLGGQITRQLVAKFADRTAPATHLAY